MTARPKDRALRVRLPSRVDPDIHSEGAPRRSHKSGFGGPPGGSPRASGIGAPEFFPAQHLQHRHVQDEIRGKGKKPLRVMKFGGTSLGGASSIGKVVEIIRAASRQSIVVVVVSAMSGVTNKLIEAATQSEAGNRKPVALIFEELRDQHNAVVSAMIHSAVERKRIVSKIQEFFQEGDRLCQETIRLGELTPRVRDSIASLGERLSAPLVATALAGRGVASEAVEATELVVTDSCHGAAEPWMDLTRERCEGRLRPLVERGIVPVVTGFIGATEEGVLTTLGRGGSDYSATILGAVLNADEVIMWKEVDGMLTADPRLVPGVCTIPEISYREAAELAHFGAKVLHPKTLRVVMPSGIPVWIRNTFAPERPGTKITPAGPPDSGGVKALTAISDVASITLSGPGIVRLPDVLGRTLSATATARADVLLVARSPSQNDVCFVVSPALANRMVDPLRREFAQDLAGHTVERITLDLRVAIVTLCGQNVCRMPGIVGRTFGALGRANVNIIAIAQGPTECTTSFVVAQKDMKAALVATHGEFQLGALDSEELPVRSP
jgi:aspartokinase/homoserine dehydrogenase 1